MKIAFVLYPQALATGVTVPAEMFNAASLVGHGPAVPLSVNFVAEQSGPVEMTGGVTLYAAHAYQEHDLFEWIFLPPMWGSPWSSMIKQDRLRQWLKNQYAQGARIVATGSGVGVVALSGLLDEKVATTHWYFLERFRKRFARVNFQTGHFITHQDGIYCAGSINAQTELVLYFIERQFGDEALALVERQFMHELKRNFTTPYYEPGGKIHDDELVSLVQSWVRSHFSESITIQQMADIAGQSERQLRRRFLKATGESPIQYLVRIRIEQAQDLLRESNLTATDIALTTGFASSGYFSRTFKKHNGMSPGDYRKMVRRKMFSE
ncbi:MAG: helix-turn-helix domain-containing protein [Reinekea sp.]|jgi:transcriptional regulator GlxA family with amidase domain